MSSVARRHAPTLRCPRCSFVIGRNTSVCENCGSWVPLEAASDSSSQFFRMIFGKRLNEMAIHDIALYLSIIPLLLGPPVAAIIIAGVKILQDRSRLHMPEWQRPLLFAAVNIILSVIIWKFAATNVLDTIKDVIYWLRDFANPASSRLTPI